MHRKWTSFMTSQCKMGEHVQVSSKAQYTHYQEKMTDKMIFQLEILVRAQLQRLRTVLCKSRVGLSTSFQLTEKNKKITYKNVYQNANINDGMTKRSLPPILFEGRRSQYTGQLKPDCLQSDDNFIFYIPALVLYLANGNETMCMFVP